MILFCPRCGAEFPQAIRGEWLESSRQCSDCGVALADPPAMLAPSDAEVTYGLDEWPVVDRSALTGALTEDAIPYRWESAVVLVVHESVEAVVDGILDDLEGTTDKVPEEVEPAAVPDEIPDDGDESDGDDSDDESDGDGDESDDDDSDDDEPDDENAIADGGEEAQAAMSDLFLAADRLQHAPWDIVLAEELAVVADIVGVSLPPYGIDAATWSRIHQLALAVDEAADGDDDAVTAERTIALREFLRPYV